MRSEKKWLILAVSLMAVGSSLGRQPLASEDPEVARILAAERGRTNGAVRIVRATDVSRGEWRVLAKAKNVEDGSERIGLWASLDVGIDVEADWVPRIEIEYLLVMEEVRSGKLTVAKARMGYSELERGEKTVGVVVSPSDLKKYGDPIWFLARVFAIDGSEIGMVQTADEEKLIELGKRKWWKEVKFADGWALKDWVWLPRASIAGAELDEDLMNDGPVEEEE